MRLKHIKLAGFKSFVDPTTIPFPSNLVGIVGPNGCGKSNVVDAIRWVMGESSAKQLRGESMDDVIFNGSSSRKPVSQASVELHFDNSDGTIGGEYAEYSDIAIKRQVSRDGQSNYYLNNVKCRRKDIIGVFLGTGLGSRSYSVIEQGMISRFIEAKPEDLRVFLEEAAGVSKYKERRKETETRLRHTRENLERLEDLREEVSKQLDKLRQQARAAERYKIFKEEERTLKAQLLVLHWQEMDRQLQDHDTIIKDYEVKIEEKVAEQRRIGADTEHAREQQTEVGDAFNEVQGRYYALGADIARLEQNIANYRQRMDQLQSDQAQIEQSWQELTEHLGTDKERVENFRAELLEFEPQLEEVKMSEMSSSDILESAEHTMSEWQQQWDDFNQQASEAVQKARVEQTRIQHLEQQMGQAKHRVEKAEVELQNIDVRNLESQIAELTINEAAVKEQITEQQQKIVDLAEQMTMLRKSNDDAQTDIDNLRVSVQKASGRQSSLKALQQATVGEGEGSAAEWLNTKSLNNNARLAKKLQITEGWETAVETVLGEYLEAVCVDDLSDVSNDLTSITTGQVTLFDTAESSTSVVANHGDLLIGHVNASVSLGNVLNGVYCVSDIDAAMDMRAKLNASESVVTKDGIWVGKHWLRINRNNNETSAIDREKELTELTRQLENDETKLDLLREQLQVGKTQLQDTEIERDNVQASLNDLRENHGHVSAQLQVKQSAFERLQQRAKQLEQEIEDDRTTIATSEDELKTARTEWEEALVKTENDEALKAELDTKRTTLRGALESAREKARSDKERLHELTLKVENARTQLATAEENIGRMQAQLHTLTERREQIQLALAEGDEPVNNLQQELETLLEQRLREETDLNSTRQRLETINETMRELETARDDVVQAVEALRSELGQQKLNLQTYDVRRTTYLEQLTELGFELDLVKEHLPEEAKIEAWQQEVEKVSNRIQRLGAINLAAIDECTVQEERKNYLDSQYDDLTEAVNTLDNAVRKIDKETKETLTETFEKVNTRFQELFPRVFGGGSAYLELTGDDLLSAGVTVMARPPGKRNSSIHLLSGGEKALTAVSLVFAIFELNPAPFCLLDEVDAPLDDSNVNRFCNLVREMSENVQFIFISHNKIAIEMAEQLAGVTMHEPGVSRIVAVDVDEAVEMATA